MAIANRGKHVIGMLDYFSYFTSYDAYDASGQCSFATDKARIRRTNVGMYLLSENSIKIPQTSLRQRCPCFIFG